MFSVLLDIAGSFFLLIGLWFFIMVFVLPMKPPADKSNRIAHLILVWEALKSPHRFVLLKDHFDRKPFLYLESDLGDFFRGRHRKG